MKPSLAIFVILLSQILIIPQNGGNGVAPPPTIGVREGDWVEYSFSFYYEFPMYAGSPGWRNETGVYISDFDYETTIKVLDVEGTNIRFVEIRRYLNDSIAFRQIVSGNPNEPHFEHPFFRVNDLFIPARLEAGDYVPQTLIFPDSQDDIIEVPWAQCINETIEKTFLGVKREVNHIYWKRHVRGNTSNGKSTFDYHVERDGYYDKNTGVMLQWFYNYSKIYRRIDTGEKRVLAGTYDYKVIDTNLWLVPPWVRREVQIATATSLSLLLFLALWRRRKL